LSGAPASIDALPEVAKVAKALNKHVLLDGGVRRGHDIVKSIALGAAACLVGRPYHWGLAVDGENGVVRVLEMYKREVDNVLA
jgi:isopentenyl diphosphate isomerase/L-lactate dehydrogenase-like FMN-dependent dehydrogenase